ncbi:hypothetical protein [Methylococcus sp. EFPC2]|uniref:hypothetical protein n=1 Tax=Methylococcus sp. EFPC2 TaxID=2812648 RepID=UPI0019683EAD|nr:hypothetical protein [Methylococcus sp. EFPC2]QSA97362.1 hypothetical protein JWZ97_00470 [Methylococcus sp. EFPC2]
MTNVRVRSFIRAAGAAMLVVAAASPGASYADGFHFYSICRADPTANKNTVTVTLRGPDVLNPDGTTVSQTFADLAGVTVNALWTYVDYRQNHAVFKYRQDSCVTQSDGSCTFNGGSGRARWQLSEVVGYNLSSPAFETDPAQAPNCPNTLMIDFW